MTACAGAALVRSLVPGSPVCIPHERNATIRLEGAAPRLRVSNMQSARSVDGHVSRERAALAPRSRSFDASHDTKPRVMRRSFGTFPGSAKASSPPRAVPSPA